MAEQHRLKSVILNPSPYPKFRPLWPAARFARLPQYIHQNERLGRERCACAFLSDTRYRGDVIRNKRREKSPFEMNGATPKKSENDVLIWSHITLARCGVETRIKR